MQADSSRANFSADSYRPLYDLLPLMYFIVDEQGLVLNVNQAGADALGYSRDELVGSSVFDIFLPEDRPRVREQVDQCREETDRIAHWEFRKVCKNGRVIWVHETVRTIHVPDGGLVFHIICEDNTRQKQMFERLQYAEMKYRSLVENVPAISYAVDLGEHPHTTFISPQVEFLLGYTQEEWLADTDFWHKAIHPDDCDRVRAEVLRNNLSGEPFFLEYRLRTKAGNYRWFRNHGVYMRNDKGIPSHTHGVMIDISDTKNIEEREKDLQTRLTRAERMESLGLLAGGVAHDLNNILGPLVAYPELIKDQVPHDTAVQQDLDAMHHAALRAADIIQDLLTLARRGTRPNEPFDINLVIRSYMSSPHGQDLGKRFPHINVKMELAPALPAASGSGTHMLQAILNLVQNAFESIGTDEPGEVSIETAEVHLERTPATYDTIPEGDYLMLRVSDTGCGIRPEDLDHIFEPFYSQKVMGHSGTGLGLSVVYGITKDMDGYINVQSELGRGSTFLLYFPKTRTAEPLRPSTSYDYAGSEALLVVDDLPEQRQLAQRLLSNLGYRVTTAKGYDDALALFRNQPYDLVLMDMILASDHDGLDIYAAMLDERPGQRAVIVSGYTETDRVQRARQLGAHAYIRKPYSMETLGRAVRDALDAPFLAN